MKNWRAVCLDGFTKDVKAATREDVVEILRENKKVQNHIKKNHPEWKTKTPEQKENWLLALVQLVV